MTESKTGADLGQGSAKREKGDRRVDENTYPEEMSDAAKLPSRENVKRRHRYCLLTFSFLYTFLFSGAFFGWGPMQLLLEENGSFASKCTVQEQERGEICPSQSAALVRIHFVATISQIVSPLLGEVVDRYGPTFLSYLMGICACTGVSLLIAAAQSPDTEWLVFASFLALANSSWMVRVTCITRLMLY